VLVHRDVDAGYTGHFRLTSGREKRGIISEKPVLLNARTGPSALSLLVALVAAADHVDHAATPNHFAVLADTLHRGTNFHESLSKTAGGAQRTWPGRP
jgi:hypothetical protein